MTLKASSAACSFRIPAVRAASLCISVALHACLFMLLGTTVGAIQLRRAGAPSLVVQIVPSTAHVEQVGPTLQKAASTPRSSVPSTASSSEGEKATASLAAASHASKTGTSPEKIFPPVFPAEAFNPARYHRVSELTVRPMPIGNIAVPYPENEARKANAALKITVYIEADGSVTSVEPDRTELPDAFAQAAQAAFLRGRFNPGQIDGRDVRSQIRVEVAFEPISSPYARSRGEPPASRSN
jgi:outer membrane biosynthesis protein TonB